jgi:hypothetical protein
MEMLGIMREAKIWCFSHSMRSVLPQRVLYHRPMIIIFNPKTHLQRQIYQTTEMQIPQMYRMNYPITHPNFWIPDRQNCYEKLIF